MQRNPLPIVKFNCSFVLATIKDFHAMKRNLIANNISHFFYCTIPIIHFQMNFSSQMTIFQFSNFLVAFESCICTALYFQTPFLYEMWQHSNRPLFKNATRNKRGQSGFNSIVCLKKLTVVQHPFVLTFDYKKCLINQDGYSKEFCGQIGQIFFKNLKIKLSGSVCFLFSTDDE